MHAGEIAQKNTLCMQVRLLGKWPCACMCSQNCSEIARKTRCSWRGLFVCNPTRIARKTAYFGLAIVSFSAFETTKLKFEAQNKGFCVQCHQDCSENDLSKKMLFCVRFAQDCSEKHLVHAGEIAQKNTTFFCCTKRPFCVQCHQDCSEKHLVHAGEIARKNTLCMQVKLLGKTPCACR